MPKRRRAERKQLRNHGKKRPERTPLSRMDWASLGVAAVLLLAMLPLFLTRGAKGALLHLCVPAYSVLERAVAAPAPQETPPLERESAPVRVTVEQSDEPARAAMSDPAREAPRILIYHTHATEAYLPTDESPYEPSGSWRTEDADKSVVAVGARLCALLETQYGFGVLHDTTNYEPPKLSSAYGRSLDAMMGYRTRYPSLSLYIDVHRDAYGSGRELPGPLDFIELDGKQVARLMCVVGTGEGATGTGFDQRPDFASNLALAQAVTDRLRAVDERLARDVRVKTGRYNQHVSGACLLIEVGHNANTLEQALNAVPYLAEAIAACAETREVPAQLPAMSLWSP